MEPRISSACAMEPMTGGKRGRGPCHFCVYARMCTCNQNSPPLSSCRGTQPALKFSNARTEWPCGLTSWRFKSGVQHRPRRLCCRGVGRRATTSTPCRLSRGASCGPCSRAATRSVSPPSRQGACAFADPRPQTLAVNLRALAMGGFPPGCLWECTSECSGQARRLIFVFLFHPN